MPGAHCAVVNCGRHFSRTKFPSVRFYKIPIGEKDETELNCSDDSSNSLTIRSDDSTEKCCEVPLM